MFEELCSTLYFCVAMQITSYENKRFHHISTIKAKLGLFLKTWLAHFSWVNMVIIVCNHLPQLIINPLPKPELEILLVSRPFFIFHSLSWSSSKKVLSELAVFFKTK